MKTSTGAVPGASSSGLIPETGAVPPRPADFMFVSNRLDAADINQLQWAADSTDVVATYTIEFSTSPDFDGTWTQVGNPITNTGVANTLTLSAQISNQWFRIRASNNINTSFYAGPIENRRPGRTCTVKGYFVDLDGDPVTDGTVEIALSTSNEQETVAGHQLVEITPEVVTPESATGFWEAKLLSSNEFDEDPGYTFKFRGSNTLETTVAKIVPDSTEEDIFFDDLVDA